MFLLASGSAHIAPPRFPHWTRRGLLPPCWRYLIALLVATSIFGVAQAQAQLCRGQAMVQLPQASARLNTAILFNKIWVQRIRKNDRDAELQFHLRSRGVSAAQLVVDGTSRFVKIGECVIDGDQFRFVQGEQVTLAGRILKLTPESWTLEEADGELRRFELKSESTAPASREGQDAPAPKRPGWQH